MVACDNCGRAIIYGHCECMDRPFPSLETRMQAFNEFTLIRLRGLANERRDCTDNEKRGLLSWAIYSVYLDCRENGLLQEAKAILAGSCQAYSARESEHVGA